LIEQAGADALELNIYFLPTDAETTSQDVERRYFEIVAAVREEISIPLAVKIGPFFTALPNIARGLVQAGADGLVLFNRYLEPEFDLDRFEIQPHLDLSQRSEMRLPLRWIALLRDQLDVSLAATSGIQDSRDVVKALAAGADVVMIASALLRYGPDYVAQLLAGIRGWMEDRQYFSVEQVRGLMSRSRCADASALERANYMQALSSYETKDDHNE
jgi:dihydroorotate dehydrogenase (fumarate)